RRHHARAVATQLDDRDQREGDALASVGGALALLLPRRLAARGRLGGLLLLGDLALEARLRHLVHAERLEQLAQDVVGREVAVLELLDVRDHLRVDELADHVPHHLLGLVPGNHGGSSYVAAGGTLARAARARTEPLAARAARGAAPCGVGGVRLPSRRTMRAGAGSIEGGLGMRSDRAPWILGVLVLSAAVPAAADLAPAKASQIVTLTTSGASCPLAGDLIDRQVLPDGTKQPFSIPEKQILVLTEFDWSTTAGDASSVERVFLSVQTSQINGSVFT